MPEVITALLPASAPYSFIERAQGKWMNEKYSFIENSSGVGGDAMNEERTYPSLPQPHFHSFIVLPWGFWMNEPPAWTMRADYRHRAVTVDRFPTIAFTATTRTTNMQTKQNRAGRSLASTPSAAASSAAIVKFDAAIVRRSNEGGVR